MENVVVTSLAGWLTFGQLSGKVENIGGERHAPIHTSLILSTVTSVNCEELEEFLASTFASYLHYRRPFAKLFTICVTNPGDSLKLQKRKRIALAF